MNLENSLGNLVTTNSFTLVYYKVRISDYRRQILGNMTFWHNRKFTTKFKPLSLCRIDNDQLLPRFSVTNLYNAWLSIVIVRLLGGLSGLFLLMSMSWFGPSHTVPWWSIHRSITHHRSNGLSLGIRSGKGMLLLCTSLFLFLPPPHHYLPPNPYSLLPFLLLLLLLPLSPPSLPLSPPPTTCPPRPHACLESYRHQCYWVSQCGEPMANNSGHTTGSEGMQTVSN